MKSDASSKKTSSKDNRPSNAAFTMMELLVVLAVVSMLVVVSIPAFARSGSSSSTLRCVNNHRQLILAWKMYAGDNDGGLPAAVSGFADYYNGRPSWMQGGLDFVGGNESNWDINMDIVVSPLWPYTAKQAEIFKCPADPSKVNYQGTWLPRVRSVSMSVVFGSGQWLDTFAGPGPYRTYSSPTEIRIPASTFVFTDEHPNSINDAAFAIQVRDAESTSPPGDERIIDFPSSFHNGASTLSFSDGRVEVHAWVGQRIQPPTNNQGSLPLNVAAEDSGPDIRWLAENTTVRE